MALLRPWVKADLKSILESGSKGAALHRTRTSAKKHVQCVEVDAEHNALRINDGESMLWCFVSTPGMKDVSPNEQSSVGESGCTRISGTTDRQQNTSKYCCMIIK